MSDDAELDREDIESEKVSDLGADNLIRLFTLRLATYHKRHDLSRTRCVGEVALEFRDDYQVNILRIIDERDYIHPDGYKWNISPMSEETIQKYDPVYPESMEDGGTADFRPGDIVELEGDPLVLVGVNEQRVVGMNKSGKLAVHPTAALRELFASSDYDPALVRDGEVIRGGLDA